MNEYLTVVNNKSTLEVKKSKFISESFFVSDEKESKKIIENIKNKSRNATHHVYSYVLLNGIAKSCDDREPAGTAGVQILKAINNFKLKNTLIVVTRYFGGIKLGVGGLSRAYFNCAANVIKTVKKVKYHQITASLSYSEYNKILNNFKIINSSFSLDVSVTFAVKLNKIDEFKSKIEGIILREINFTIQNDEYFDC